VGFISTDLQDELIGACIGDRTKTAFFAVLRLKYWEKEDVLKSEECSICYNLLKDFKTVAVNFEALK